DAAGTYKPSAHAFRLWSQVYRRYPHLLQVALPSAESQVPLWVLAARNDQGDIALLVANTSADAVTWSPRFADGTTLTDYAQVELYQVDGTNDGRTSTPLTGSAVTTAPYAAQLLVLELATAPTPTPSPSATPTSTPTATPTPVTTHQLSQVATAVVTTAEEDGGARPEIVFLNDQFHIVYRDTLTQAGSFRLKVLDRDLNSTGREEVLVSSDADGGVTDIRLTSDDQFVYVAYEKSLRSPSSGRNLFLEKYNHAFERLASRLVVAVGEPGRGVEALDDPMVVVADGRPYVITKIEGGYRVREFDLNLNPAGQVVEIIPDLDIGIGSVGSALYVDGFFYLITSVHVAGTPICPRSDATTNNDLVVLKYNPDWTYAGFQKTIADTSLIERYPTGFKYVAGKFYVTYISTDPATDTIECGRDEQIGTGTAHLRVFDQEFNLLAETQVAEEGEVTNHPTLEVVGNRIYIAYGHKEAEGLGPGNSNVWIRVFEITSGSTPALNRPEDPQIGLNFIRFFWESPGEPDTTTPYVQPEWIFDDFAELGIHAFRQFVRADLLWNTVEPQNDEWNFDQADAVITNPDFEPIVTLFSLQYASATPPWATDSSEFQKTLGPEARDYLETIIQRYGPYVKYWEIGNEMDHWRAADPDAVNPNPPNLPPSYPLDGFSPQEQGVFLAQVAAFIRERDPDAVIIMPGMGGLDDHTLNTWFAGVIEGGGTDWFDVVNYHYYPTWQAYSRRRQDLQTFLEDHGIADKPVWLTETGSTASPTLTVRTDYPNSPESQAADVFRRLIQAYGYGDSLAIWHTYIGSPDTPGNMWRLYGIRTDTAEAQPSYYTFKLLTTELIPFESVEILSSVPAGENSFKITTEAGDVKYVAWGSGNFAVPAGMTQMTLVIPNTDGSFTWQVVEAGDVIALAPEPVLLK
ncbi:MAG: hypothetical protein ACE5F6_13420, partial [Anaerolineae bacterium]